MTVVRAGWPTASSRYIDGPIHRMDRYAGGTRDEMNAIEPTVEWFDPRWDRITSCGLRLPWADSVMYEDRHPINRSFGDWRQPLRCGDSACFGDASLTDPRSI